jgi:serine/threonine-protein kinase
VSLDANEDEIATVREPSRRVSPVSHAEESLTVQRALREPRAQGQRRMVLAGLVIIAIGTVMVSSVEGRPVAVGAMIASLALASVAGLAYWVTARPRWALSPVRQAAMTICVALCLPGVSYYFGLGSAFLGVVVMMVVVTALAAPLATSAAVLAITMIAHGALYALIVGDVVPDQAIAPLRRGHGLEDHLLFAGVEALFVFGFVAGAIYRRVNTEQLARVQAATRALAESEALLEEVRQQLGRSAGVGGPGLFTGQTLGSYVLGNLLARGGLGEIYEAAHADRGTPAAVKVMHHVVMSDPRAVARFIAESKATSALDSEHIVRVLEVGGLDAKIPFIAMERLRGRDLAEVLREVRALPPVEAIRMLRQVAAGIEVAHAAGIVHRDLKPGNVFVAQAEGALPTYKIIDFGVSKLLGDAGHLTRDQVVGTPAYMAPEQILGDPVDRRTDVYALGAIAYRVLTGRPAFRGEPAVIYHAVLTTEPAAPSTVAELPPDIDAVLAIAMAKRPEDRYADATSFVNAVAGAWGADQPSAS